MSETTYIEREEQLIDAIAHMKPHWSVTLQSGYDPQAHRDASFKRLSSDTTKLFDYMSAQDQLENASRQASRFYPGDAAAQVNHIRSFDHKRKLAHDQAIEAIRDLNRLSAEYGTAPFADMSEQETYDPTNRWSLHVVANTYVSQAREANALFAQDHPTLPRKTDDYETRRRQAHELDQANDHYEQQQRRQDYESSYRTWRAVGTYDEHLSDFYSPEQDAQLRAKDPDYEQTLATRDANRAAEKRETKNTNMRTMISTFGLVNEPDEKDEDQIMF